MDCLFCKIIKKEINSNIIYEDDLIICIMDAFPISDGHLLIIPKTHYETILDLPNEVLCRIHEVSKKLIKELIKKMNTKSLKTTINYGDAQEIKHFHYHIIPIGSNTKTVEENYQILKGIL